ncbi:MAG: hypothetical protein ACR2OZ_07760 [Verrucomicrobiales bacterium]
MRQAVFALVTLVGLFPVSAADNEWLANASFCQKLNEDKSPAVPTDGFGTGDTVRLSLELKQHPKKGLVTARFYFRDEVINEARVDLEKQAPPVDANAKLFIAFSLKPKDPFPVSDQYRVEAMLDNHPLGTFRFRIEPPEGATRTELKKVVLVKSMPEDLADAEDESAFGGEDAAILAGIADVGKLSWLQAEWFVNGRRDEAATQTQSSSENKTGAVFQFKHRPAGGWKPGRHEVALVLDGKEVARKQFSVRAPADAGEAEAAMAVPVLKAATLHRDDGAGRAGDAVDSFSPADRVLHFVCDLENTVKGAAGEITWTIVEAEGGLRDIVMARAPLSTRIANRLAGRFTASRTLPKGRYRVEVTCLKKPLARRDFEVK